jgi:hypothetical protein
VVYNTSNSGVVSNWINCIAIDDSGNKWIGTDAGLAVFKEGGVVSAEENSNPKSQLPSHITLYQNYPNPFNPTTTIEFAIPTSGYVSLKVFNITGQEVATLVNKELILGNHKVEWNPQNLSSGLYFYKLETKGYIETKKLILMK